MPATFLLLAVLAATQSPPAAAPVAAAPAVGRGRPFLSPMGEPFHAAGSDGLTDWFNQADANHDGSILLEEMQKDAERFFNTLDRTKDGEIDPDDLEHYETVIAPEVRGGSWSGQEDDESSGGSRLGVLNIPEPVAAADANLNRGVSLQEFVAAAQKRFALLDTNGDGRLTLAELQASRSAIRANARRARNHYSDPTIDAGVPPIGGPTAPQRN